MLHYDLFKPVFGRVFDIAVIQNSVWLNTMVIFLKNILILLKLVIVVLIKQCTLTYFRPVYARHSFVNTDKNLYISLPYIQ